MQSTLTNIFPVEPARCEPARDASTCGPVPDLPVLDRCGATADQRWLKRKRQETRVARRERLHRAAGEAIARAAETDGDPVALMTAATGAEAKYCDPVIRRHPLFVELRARFLMPEERVRKEQQERDAAAVAAEPGLIVWVRRQFNNRRRAAYRMSDLSGLHWSGRSGGTRRRANRLYLHAYVWCDAMIAGAVAHSCRHGKGPHRIKVCITKVDNKKTWEEIEGAAPARPMVPARGRQAARTERRVVRRQRLDQNAVSP